MTQYIAKNNKDSYQKIVKFKIHDSPGCSDNMFFNIINNKTLVVMDGLNIIKLKVPDYIHTLIIDSLRNPYDNSTVKFKLYNLNNAIWAKMYIDQIFLKKMGDEFSRAPDALSAIILQYSIIDDINTVKPKYTDSDIAVAQNPQPTSERYLCYLKIHPYNHQQNNIQWMREKEENIKMDLHKFDYLDIKDLIHFKTKRHDIYMDPITHILYNGDSLWASDRVVSVKFKGGVLCDYVGSGKTLSMVGLILADKYRFERPKKTQPIKTIIKIKAKPIITVKSLPESAELIPVSVGATLILCPRRLIGQWVDEINKYTDNLSVIEMSTMAHVTKYSYNDIRSYDVVVASFELLNNKTYREQQSFTLNRIKWRRVIVDEGHEVLLHQLKKLVDDLRVSTAIFNIPSDYRWVCTGTPLVFTISSLQAIISFICGLGHNQVSPILDNITLTEYHNIMEQLFHKNTKESTASQINIPDTIDHVEFLTFTPTEEAIYKAIPPDDTERQLQVCTNINVSETDSGMVGGIILNLDQVTKAMATHHKSNCDKLEQDIIDTEKKILNITEDANISSDILDKDIDKLEKSFRLEKNNDLKADLRKQIQDTKDEKRKIHTNSKNRIVTANALIEKTHVHIAESRKQVQIFRSIDITHISKSECPILGIPLSSDKVAITPDGYYYSQKGISLLFTGGKKTIMCPYLRKPIEQSELLIVDPKSSTNNSEMDVDRAKWGTKMIHVIRTLRRIVKEDDTNRIIIFSRWTKMLILMSHALKDNKINFVFCRGNVHVIKKSIRQFKSDDTYKVMLLSSESCNSGTNLTEASYVFLLDSVGSDVEQTKAVESQAIARAKRLGQKKNVHVYRFVMKDTVEETYYKAMNATP